MKRRFDGDGNKAMQMYDFYVKRLKMTGEEPYPDTIQIVVDEKYKLTKSLSWRFNRLKSMFSP